MNIISGLAKGQVLQRLGSRGATVQIKGISVERGAVFATISQAKRVLKGWKKRAVGKATNNKFSAELKGIPAGGPYHLVLEINEKRLEVSTFYVGDVWVLAGQSNMEGVGNMTGVARPHPLIQAFSMRREWELATEPLHILPESPDVCHHGGTQLSPKYVEIRKKHSAKGAGVGIVFAREMLKRSGVPQGLICTAHGGTSMEQWDPARKNLGGESLYASMLESVQVTGQPVSGILWYQGESETNAAAAPLYTERMQKLVAASRRDIKQPKLKWIIVQIARFLNESPDFVYWNSIQEQQRLLPNRIKDLEMVAAIDLPLDDLIHISTEGYFTLGKRLARAADRLIYGNQKEKRPPQLSEIRLHSPTPDSRVALSPSIEVKFDDVAGSLQSDGEPYGFSLVGPSGKSLQLIYKTVLHGNCAFLYVQGPVPADARLSYGHGYFPYCNITDGRDFSLPVFGPCEISRNDGKGPILHVTDWKVTDVVAETRPLNAVPCPDVESLNPMVKKYGEKGFPVGLEGFINEWPAWERKNGQAYFQTKLYLEEPMKLAFQMGYDGPFKLWLNGKSFFTDINGTNPCVPNKAQKEARLTPGSHDLRVGMDLAEGRVWGFFLRIRRLDFNRAQIRSGKFVMPTVSV